PAAVGCARHASRGDRLGHRLQSRVPIAPLVVQLNDPLEGRTDLLTLGVRVVTGMELGRRRALQTEHTHLPGWHPANQTKSPAKPTAARSRQALAAGSLTRLKNAGGEESRRRLTALAGFQEDSRQRRG